MLKGEIYGAITLFFMQVPSVEDISWVERASIVLVLFFLGALFLGALFTRRIILGTTHELLMQAEREKTVIAQNEAIQARKDLSRIADEFNQNLERILQAVLPRDGK
jgi:hypothetical protein